MGNYNLKSGVFRCENCFSIYRMTIEPGLPESYVNLECKCSTSRASIKNFLTELTKGTKCKPKCYECHKTDEKNTSYCEDCNHLYCGKCINKDHHKHNNISIAKLDFNCVFHQKENFCAFCKDCVINLCPKCIESKRHMNHDVVEFDKILMTKTEREFLKDKFNLAQEKLLFNNNLINNVSKYLKNKDAEKIADLGKDNNEQNKIIIETVNFFMYLYDNSKFKNYNIIVNFIEHVNNLNVNKFRLSDKNMKLEDNLDKLQKYLTKDFIVINGEDEEEGEIKETNEYNYYSDNSTNKQEQIITSKIQCVTKYSKYIDGKIRNVYVMENVLSQRFLDDYPPFFLSNKSIFLEYNADSKQSDTTVTVSFNKDDKELTVTHNINSADILIQKDKMHGIKIKYITNSSESEDD